MYASVHLRIEHVQNKIQMCIGRVLLHVKNANALYLVSDLYCIYSRRKKNTLRFRSRSVPFRFTGNERAEKWRAVLPVFPVPPVLPSNPSACARSNESCFSGDPAYRRVCTQGHQYPPSLAPSLARPELNGRKRTERNG